MTNCEEEFIAEQEAFVRAAGISALRNNITELVAKNTEQRDELHERNGKVLRDYDSLTLNLLVYIQKLTVAAKKADSKKMRLTLEEIVAELHDIRESSSIERE